MKLITGLVFLPWQKVFLPGQWKKLVKTGKNWQKAVCMTDLRSYWHTDDLQRKKAELVKPQAIKFQTQSN